MTNRQKKYHEKHNITETPKCVVCGKDAYWAERSNKYSDCCSQSCRSKKSFNPENSIKSQIDYHPNHTPEYNQKVVDNWNSGGVKVMNPKEFELLEHSTVDQTLKVRHKKCGGVFDCKKSTFIDRYKRGVPQCMLCVPNKSNRSWIEMKIASELSKHILGLEVNKTIDSYKVDMFHNNKVLEYNGDFWHANPEMYKPDDAAGLKGKTAKEIWEADKEKLNHLKSLGMKVKVLWEKDYLENSKAAILECIRFFS